MPLMPEVLVVCRREWVWRCPICGDLQFSWNQLLCPIGPDFPPPVVHCASCGITYNTTDGRVPVTTKSADIKEGRDA